MKSVFASSCGILKNGRSSVTPALWRPTAFRSACQTLTTSPRSTLKNPIRRHAAHREWKKRIGGCRPLWKKKKTHRLCLHHPQDPDLRRIKHHRTTPFHRCSFRQTRTARRVHHHSLRTHRQTASRITSFCRRSPRRVQIGRSHHH